MLLTTSATLIKTEQRFIQALFSHDTATVATNIVDINATLSNAAESFSNTDESFPIDAIKIYHNN